MLFPIRDESRLFMELVGKALSGALTPHEDLQFKSILKKNPHVDREFVELKEEIQESKLDEVWERGLRVLFRCPQPEDKPFLNSLKKSDPKAWSDFNQGLYVLKVISESMGNPSKEDFCNKLTKDQESDLLSAVNEAKEQRKKRLKRLSEKQ